MAKNFPYFKFIATEWLTGNIVYESLSAQGLFINICATYWQRNGKLSLEEVNRRYKNPVELSELTDRFFSLTDGFIIIKFLDEQLTEAGHVSKINKENGKKGGRPKSLIPLVKKPTPFISLTESKAKQSNKEEEREKEEKEKERDNNSPTTFESVFQEITNSERWIEETAMTKRISKESVKEKLIYFLNDLKLKDDYHKGYKEIKGHFISWLNLNKDKKNTQEPGLKLKILTD